MFPSCCRSAPLALALAVVTCVPSAAIGQSSAEIDRQVWQAVAKSVVDHDIAAMGRVYHPAAVLVSQKGTTPISAALDRWGRDMVTARTSGAKASVEFRFTTRQDDATTAFEAGAFRYATTDRAGVTTPGYVRFEALLVKTAAGWQMVMERQLEAITETEWNSLPR
jgi:ketosteroid isomerase-like protein